MVLMQKEKPRENSHISIAGRPDINEISKRNEAIAKQERKSFYKVAGIIVFLIIAIIFWLYFFIYIKFLKSLKLKKNEN